MGSGGFIYDSIKQLLDLSGMVVLLLAKSAAEAVVERLEEKGKHLLLPVTIAASIGIPG